MYATVCIHRMGFGVLGSNTMTERRSAKAIYRPSWRTISSPLVDAGIVQTFDALSLTTTPAAYRQLMTVQDFSDSRAVQATGLSLSQNASPAASGAIRN